MEYRKKLGILVDRRYTEKLRDAARAFDVAEAPGNCFDANWGGVQCWCKPGDLPTCWDAPLTPGAWGPSELVGDITWEANGDREELVLVIWARELIDFRRQQARQAGKTWLEIHRGEPLTEADQESLFAWLEGKLRELIRLADLQPAFVGTRCPFCEWTLYSGELLNGLLEHISAVHPEYQIKEISLGQPTLLKTDRGAFPLGSVEDFRR